jgi:hypothetical protein
MVLNRTRSPGLCAKKDAENRPGGVPRPAGGDRRRSGGAARGPAGVLDYATLPRRLAAAGSGWRFGTESVRTPSVIAASIWE